MELSIFLAKVLGLYLVLACLAALLKRRELAPLVDEYFNNRILVFFSGAIILILGLLVVVSHNIWEFGWRGAITLLGWLTVAKGLARLYAPEYIRPLAKAAIHQKFYTLIVFIFLIVGLWLAYAGFGA